VGTLPHQSPASSRSRAPACPPLGSFAPPVLLNSVYWNIQLCTYLNTLSGPGIAGNRAVKSPFWDSRHWVLARKIWNSGGSVCAVARPVWGRCEHTTISPSRRFLAQTGEVDLGSPRSKNRSWGPKTASGHFAQSHIILYITYNVVPSHPGQ
jgi:hypothetical protein